MEKQIKWNNKNIFYEVSGSGPAIVLIHGFLENHHIWDELILQCKEKYKLIAIDLPGFGKSSVYGKVHTMEFMADAVKAVMENENTEKGILIGHSMGGYVTVAFTEKYQDAVSGIVFFHSQVAADTPEGRENRKRAIEIAISQHADYITKFIPSLFAPENINKFSDRISQLRKQSIEAPKEGVVAALAGMAERIDGKELLKNIHIPVFFVVGKQDSRISLDEIMRQMSLPKNTEAIILDHVGHMGFIEAPEKIFPVLESFCERIYQ